MSTPNPINLNNLDGRYSKPADVAAAISAQAATDAGQYALLPNTTRNIVTGSFYVTGFGAKCDGSTDDTVAVQNAINAAQAAGAGNTVLFPPGTTLVTGITVAVNKLVRLQGSGIGYVGGDTGTRIKRYGTGTSVLMQGVGTAGVIPNVGDPTKRCRVEIYDMELNGNNTSGEVLNIFRGSQVRIERVRVRDSTGTGAHFTQLFNSALSQFFVSYVGNGTTPAMLIDGTTGEGTAAGSNTVHFTDCEWETNAGIDIKIDGSSADSSPSAGIMFTNTKIERNSGEFPEIYFGYCHTVQFNNLYAYVQSSATAIVQQAGSVATPNKINNATIANGGSAAYYITHTAGALHVTDTRFSGTPTTAYVQVSATVAYNAHFAKNISGDSITKLYSDARGAGAIGQALEDLQPRYATISPESAGVAGGGWPFVHGSSSDYVTGQKVIRNDALVGATAALIIRWTPKTATGGNVVWAARAQNITTGAVLSSTGYISSSATTAAGTTALAVIDSAGPGLTVNPSHTIRWTVYRDGTNAADTYTDAVDLLEVRLSVQVTI